MTTRVTVQVPAQHAARVTLIDLVSDEQRLFVLEAGTVQDFHVHEYLSLRVDEGEPVVAAAPGAVPG